MEAKKQMKHTPGKWLQSHREIPNDPDGMYATQVYTEDGETICSLAWYRMPPKKVIIDGKPMIETGTYREANAKLIAAAPELLASLIKAEDFISRSLTLEGKLTKDEIEFIVGHAREAIKKATE